VIRSLSLSLLLIPSLLVLGQAPATATPMAAGRCVRLARTWEDAVAEARLLHVPIVVHDHGFYCPPCWRMHATVLANPDYIAFAREKAVDVLCLSRLEEGMAEGAPRAATLARMRDGRRVRCLAEFPDLTPREALMLRRSPAAVYNRTGMVPYTAIVDPYSLQEVRGFSGFTNVRVIMDAAEAAGRTLELSHGKGFCARTWCGVVDTIEEAWKKADRGEYGAAVKLIDARAADDGDWPHEVRQKLETTRREVLHDAERRLSALRATSRTDPGKAHKDLEGLLPHLDGTGLEDKAGTLLTETQGT
jgi:hypothetical protein